ncbi:MAG TPA: Hsp20/alpha crystallin family protein [Terriglobia bacterium]|nr:Hsp20/alpha crystallin family protein [Terriglobia bacterium]
MQVTRWEPFRDLVSTQDRLNQLFNDTFARALGSAEAAPRAWVPPVDIYETGENLVLQAELPGVNPDDVEIRVEDNTLYLKGERKFEKAVKEESFHHVERSYGTFNRSFALPGSIDADKVKAEYTNGVLTLTLPKREEAKPRTIKINVA